ncbi:glycosyltransferase family 2 protein [Enterococcus hulanensis]|uniref:Glycosyltransferase family 2 protein n=1 Tax=Enterococcus hulanensis TaxID=2559929 RepID=A0ABU3EWP2_9ENTE|nr:glycosyltransferase family 2 protein [Enterococcus hulanensis]MDT2599285.1 glycosyltransferase family 2 protein [Enterococcus hulanensis]MDT2608692.1 glycosyltransferase family 2 protein [Enterococcus hulanensis]MDT2616447.1 glycosyltransferase family 2 protein [Enterococcus hulanensis]MDT2627513.1 glycosyltransferase family 2 protein [Enterococcus hulanensis]MDT2655543.1 glycosyltransferase family 2 protein [Enterococcus hulanensis]
MNNEKIAILIPCYNESLTIKKVINDFQRELPEADIYVYDNNSTDNTYEIALNEGAIVKKEPRQGKGNVIRQMFFDIEADYYLMVDGDDTYPAENSHELIAALREGSADMVIGDRLSNGTYFNENKRAFHDFGNNLVKNSINRLYQANIKDVMTGYRGFNRMFVKSFPVMSSGFQIETEFTIHALDKRFKLVEIPIDYRDRPEGSESKLDTYSDGLKVLLTILKMFKDYKPLLFFSVFSLIFCVFGLAFGVPVINEFIHTGFITKVPSSILATGLMVFALLLLITGLILDTVVTNAKKEYELHLYRLYEETIQKEKI